MVVDPINNVCTYLWEKNMADTNLSAEDIKAIGEAMGKSLGDSRAIIDVKDMKALSEGIKGLGKNLKEQQPLVKSLNSIIKGNQVGFQDASEALKQLDKALEQAKETIQHSASREERIAAGKVVRDAGEQKRAIAIGVVQGALIAGFGTLANALVNYELAMASVALDYQAGMIAGKAANDLYTDSAKSAAKANSELTSGYMQVVEIVGGVVSALGWVIPQLRALRLVFAGLGAVIGFGAAAFDRVQKTATELNNKGLEILNAQLNKTIESFKEINSIGGILSNGMGQLNALGVQSGYGIKIFSDGLSKSRDSITEMGYTFEEAANRIAEVGNILHRATKSGDSFAKQLDKLGIVGQEQVELTAMTMARMRMAGDKDVENTEKVALETLEYGKSLKILQDITGKNAKEALKEAQKKALRADILARYSDPAQQQKVAAAIAAAEARGFGDQFMEYLSKGNLYSPESIVAAQQVPELLTDMKSMVSIINDNSQQGAEANARLIDLTSDVARSTNERLRAGGPTSLMGQSGFVKGGAVAGARDILSSISAAGASARRGQATEDLKHANAQARTRDKLTDSVVRATESNLKQTAAMDKTMLPQITKFSEQIADTAGGFGTLKTATIDVINYFNKLSGKPLIGESGEPSPTAAPTSDSGKFRTDFMHSFGMQTREDEARAAEAEKERARIAHHDFLKHGGMVAGINYAEALKTNKNAKMESITDIGDLSVSDVRNLEDPTSRLSKTMGKADREEMLQILREMAAEHGKKLDDLIRHTKDGNTHLKNLVSAA